MKKILLVEPNQTRQGKFLQFFGEEYQIHCFENPLKAYQFIEKEDVDLIISVAKLPGLSGLNFLRKIRLNDRLKRIPFLLLTPNDPLRLLNVAHEAGANDVYHEDVDLYRLQNRIKYLTQIKTNSYYHQFEQNESIQRNIMRSIKPGFWKRTFDLVVGIIALILVLPVLILAAIAIRLESPGSFYYTSKRVGAGYKIFNLYKLRTMYIGADSKLKDLDNDNQYKREVEMQLDLGDDPELVHDGGIKIPESEHLKKLQEKSAFNKIKSDPRVTRVGRFLRKTSIDELPQLINIIKGDISFVGNRPLPLYEAEQLTYDSASERFLAPAGLTGLWQVKQRGTDEVTEQERIRLDNEYARTRNFWLDMKIFFWTFKAVFQQSDV